MSIRTAEELAALERAGRVVAETIAEVRRRLVPGMTTGDVDAIAEEVFARHGARSAPRDTYGFPGCICLSVDDEAVHGIPGDRVPREGQLLKVAVTAELGGVWADARRPSPAATRAAARRARGGARGGHGGGRGGGGGGGAWGGRGEIGRAPVGKGVDLGGRRII